MHAYFVDIERNGADGQTARRQSLTVQMRAPHIQTQQAA